MASAEAAETLTFRREPGWEISGSTRWATGCIRIPEMHRG